MHFAFVFELVFVLKSDFEFVIFNKTEVVTTISDPDSSAGGGYLSDLVFALEFDIEFDFVINNCRPRRLHWCWWWWLPLRP